MRANELPARPSRRVLTIGMAPADRGLEIERDAVLLGERRERDAVAREQRLVGGDHRFSGRQRGLDRGLGRIALAAHQLDEHVDLADRSRARPGRRPSAIFADRRRASCRATARSPRRPRSAGRSGRSGRRAARSIRRTTDAPTVPKPARPSFSGAAIARRQPAGGRRVSAAWREERRCATFRGPLSRKRRMLRAAWRMRCSFSTSAMRT